MLTCQQFSARVDSQLDGVLPPPEAEELRAHALLCAACTRHLAQRQALLVGLRRVWQQPQPVALSPRLLEAFKQRRASPSYAFATWIKRICLGLAVVVSAALALTPAAEAPAPGGMHLPCSWVILAAALLPVGVVWGAMRRVGRALSMQGAAALGAVGALAGQLLVGVGCPVAHVQKHLLVSHFAALVLACVVSAAWARWAPRAVQTPP